MYSEKLIKNLFEMARNKKPSIIFIEDINLLTDNRLDKESEISKKVKAEYLH